MAGVWGVYCKYAENRGFAEIPLYMYIIGIWPNSIWRSGSRLI